MKFATFPTLNNASSTFDLASSATLSKPQLVFRLLSCHLWVFYSETSWLLLKCHLCFLLIHHLHTLCFIRLFARCPRNLINKPRFWLVLACPQISHYFLADVFSYYYFCQVTLAWVGAVRRRLANRLPEIAFSRFWYRTQSGSEFLAACHYRSFWRNWSVCAMWQAPGNFNWELTIENLGKFG